MRNVRITTRFKKDFDLVKKSNKFKKYSAKFESYVETLRIGEKLPPEAKNHPMAKHSPKEYLGCWDFHVAPDVCVLYRLTDEELQLVRIGQHNTLGLTENFID